MYKEELFDQYTKLSKETTKHIKSNAIHSALDCLNESLELSLKLSTPDKWYTETAYRKIRLLIKFNLVTELETFREQYSQVVKKFKTDPFQKFSISNYFNHMALIDEYFAYRFVIKSIEKRIFANSLVNDEMIRQKRESEVKANWKVFYNEILELINKHSFKISNKNALNEYIRFSSEEIKSLKLFDGLIEIINFPVLLR